MIKTHTKKIKIEDAAKTVLRGKCIALKSIYTHTHTHTHTHMERANNQLSKYTIQEVGIITEN